MPTYYKEVMPQQIDRVKLLIPSITWQGISLADVVVETWR